MSLLRVGQCVPANMFTYTEFKELVGLLIAQGFILHPMFTVEEKSYPPSKFIGIDQNGEIVDYDLPWSFLPLDAWQEYRDLKDDDYPNILRADEVRKLKIVAGVYNKLWV